MYEYKGLVTNIVDGDTVDILIDLGFDVKVKQRLRFSRINAYEIKLKSGTTSAEKKLGVEAKQYLKELIEGKEVFVKTEKDKTEKYGRYLVEIFFNYLNLEDI